MRETIQNTSGKQFHAVSLSGGKDSSAMLLLMIERGMPIDMVLSADTGMEFPEMYEHLAKLDEHLFRERGMHIDDIGSSTKVGKQFITLESKNGNVFYMIIDRDDEGEETVHFLNQVDEADLMALTGEEETPATCSCTTKCVAGTVNTSCPVCAVNMTECVGKEAKPEVPTEPTEPAAEEPEKKSGVGGILVVLLIVALGGGAAFYIFKQKKAKPQTKGSADLDDYDYGEDEDEYEFEPYEGEPEQDTTEDTDT